MKVLKYFILPALLLSALSILFFAPEWLGIAILDKYSFPLGTIISWIIVLIIPLFMFFILPLKKSILIENIIKKILFVNTVVGAFWGVISYFLSGNWTFTFENKTGFKAWIFLTIVTVLVPFILLVVSLLAKLFRKK